MKQERSFEGISLETPGSSSKSVLQMSRFQLCKECYASANDAAAMVRVSRDDALHNSRHAWGTTVTMYVHCSVWRPEERQH